MTQNNPQNTNSFQQQQLNPYQNFVSQPQNNNLQNTFPNIQQQYVGYNQVYPQQNPQYGGYYPQQVQNPPVNPYMNPYMNPHSNGGQFNPQYNQTSFQGYTNPYQNYQPPQANITLSAQTKAS